MRSDFYNVIRKTLNVKLLKFVEPLKQFSSILESFSGHLETSFNFAQMSAKDDLRNKIMNFVVIVDEFTAF